MEQRYHATNQEDQLILSFPENQMIFPRNMNILALYFVSRTLFRNHVLIGQRHHATNINQEVQYHFLKTGSVTCDIVYLRNCQRPDGDAMGTVRRIVLFLNVCFRFQNIEHVVPGFSEH